MNIEKALKILREKGNIITRSGKGWEVRWPCSTETYYYTDRKLINWAREYTSEGQQTPVNSNVKYFRHRNNRHHTKQSLAHERYEEFFQGKLRKDEDRWNWD